MDSDVEHKELGGLNFELLLHLGERFQLLRNPRRRKSSHDAIALNVAAQVLLNRCCGLLLPLNTFPHLQAEPVKCLNPKNGMIAFLQERNILATDHLHSKPSLYFDDRFGNRLLEQLQAESHFQLRSREVKHGSVVQGDCSRQLANAYLRACLSRA